MPFVLDCSVTMAWVLPDERTDYADAVRRRLRRDEAFVPALWRLEVINAFLTAERRRRLSLSITTQQLAHLAGLPIVVESPDPGDRSEELLSLGRVHGLTAYDAAYADLALRRNVPLATLDNDLRRAAEELGIPLLT